MTATELFEAGLERANLRRTDPEAYDVSCLLEEVCGIGRPLLPLRGEEIVSSAQAERFFALLQRWLQAEPLQYLLGKWEFFGLPFEVGPGVLIPRQDTEALAQCAIDFLCDKPGAVVADLCAGSGCLAGTIAHICGARVYALELSKDALPYLRRNMRALGADVTVLEADVLSPPALPQLDLVVSNPPYISAEEMAVLDAQVLKEPEMALYGGVDGCDFYRALPQLYFSRLRCGGALMLEVGYRQAAEVAQLMRTAGYADVYTTNDLAGIPRVVVGIRPSDINYSNST